MLRIRFLISCLVLLAAALASCMPSSLLGTATATATPLPVTVTPPPDTATPQPSATPLLVSPTISALELSQTPPPTKTKLPTKTKIPTKTKVPPKMMNSKIFLIAVGDNGVAGKKIGCGDSAVPVVVQLPFSEGILRASLEKLLSIKDQYYGQSGLYNVFYQSSLTVDKLTIKSGLADIRLKGTLTLAGVCDSPRVQAQLEETTLQFSTVKQVNIYVNNTPLEKILSEK